MRADQENRRTDFFTLISIILYWHDARTVTAVNRSHNSWQLAKSQLCATACPCNSTKRNPRGKNSKTDKMKTRLCWCSFGFLAGMTALSALRMLGSIQRTEERMQVAELKSTVVPLTKATTRTTSTTTSKVEMIDYSPSVTDTMAAAAFNSLDADNAWMKHVRFLVIGAQKGGSTSLYMYLNSHSKTESRDKECYCFEDYTYESWDPACERKLRIWSREDDEDFIVGDYTPGYIHRTEEVIPRVQRTYPWVKIIAVLREPSSRAYSQYRMKCEEMPEVDCNDSFLESVVLRDLQSLHLAGMLPHWYFNKPVEEATLFDWLNAPVDESVFEAFFGTVGMVLAWKEYFKVLRPSPFKDVVSQGLYSVCLARWMTAFPKDRFLILPSASFDNNQLVATMSKVYSFLDLPFEELESTEKANVGADHDPMNETIKNLLRRVYEPFNAKLEALLGEEWRDPFPTRST